MACGVRAIGVLLAPQWDLNGEPQVVVLVLVANDWVFIGPARRLHGDAVVREGVVTPKDFVAKQENHSALKP